MKEKLIRFVRAAWEERIRFIKYFLSGLGAVAWDLGIYALLTRGFHLGHRPSNIISVLFGATWAFLLNKFWSFKAAGNTVRQSRRFLILFVVNYFLQQALFWIGVDALHLYDGLVKVVIMAMVVAWNFLLYRFWVYARD